MEDVATRAGLSKAAIYLYFKDKMALLQALVNEMAGGNISVARGIAEQHEGPVGPLLATILTFMARQLRDTRFPELLKVVISESRAHPDIGQALSRQRHPPRPAAVRGADPARHRDVASSARSIPASR